MAEQAVVRVKRVSLAIPLPSRAALRAPAWMLGPPLLIGLLAALIATQLQTPVWRSKAEVGFTLLHVDRTRYLDEQANLARSPVLAVRVIRTAKVPGVTPAQFLRHSGAKPRSDAAILTLSVTYRRGAIAARLANAYAIEFAGLTTALDLRTLHAALGRLNTRIRRLRALGQTGTPGYRALVEQQSQLRYEGLPLAHSAKVLQKADGASSFRPHALRNGLLGGALGALLGVALVLAIAVPRRRSGSGPSGAPNA
jgi:hypothetical protein